MTTMFVQVFETVNYLTFHLPWGLENLCIYVMTFIHCLKICVLMQHKKLPKEEVPKVVRTPGPAIGDAVSNRCNRMLYH